MAEQENGSASSDADTFNQGVKALWEQIVAEKVAYLEPKIKGLSALPSMDQQDFSDAITEVIEWQLVTPEEIGALNAVTQSQIYSWVTGTGIPERGLKNSMLKAFYEATIAALRKKKVVTVTVA